MERRELRIVIVKEEDMFLAQCLEHDICAQAKDISTLQRRLEDTFRFESEAGSIDGIPPAPEHFRKLWNDGFNLESKFDNADVHLPSGRRRFRYVITSALGLASGSQ